MVLQSSNTIYCVIWWEEMDSNHRSRKTTDLQSVAFGRSAIFPKIKLTTIFMIISYWSWWSESNQQPSDYKSDALPLSHTSIGAAGRNRTTDTEIFSLMLYRLSYRGKSIFSIEIDKTIWRPRTGSNRRPPA